MSAQRRIELGLFALLVALYVGAVVGFDPGFARRPYAVVTHLLLLLATAAVFLGLWDWFGLTGLRRLLRRDRDRLWKRYGRVEALEMRLAGLLLAATLPGGSVDRLLSLGPAPKKPAENTAAVQELRPRPEDAPPDPPMPPPPAEGRHFEMALGDLLERYDHAVEPEQHRQQVFAHLRYLVPRDEIDEIGEPTEARTFASDKVALAGLQDVVDPPEESWRLDRAFPRVVARLDCQLREGWLRAVPSVTYAVLDGLGAPRVENAGFLHFTDLLAAEGLSSSVTRGAPSE